MSRNTKILSFVAAASIAVASLASQSADARGFGGFGGGMSGGRILGGHFASFSGAGGRLGPITPHPVLPSPPPGYTPIRFPIPIHLPPVTPPPGPSLPPIPVHLGPLPLPLPLPTPTPGPGPGTGPDPGDHDHHHHHHHHWAFIGGVWVVLDDVTNEIAVADPEDGPAPGPCTCLTKTYTSSGLVVFADVCTKESASASVYGNASAQATQVPTTPVAATAVPMSVVPTTPDYAGRTYEDYLAANPQLAQPQAAAPQATQKN
jgi:hypothetical protein